MTSFSCDLNSDSGESFGSWVMGDDAAMMGIVTSANIACGFHAGDLLAPETLVGRAVDQSADRPVSDSPTTPAPPLTRSEAHQAPYVP